MGWRVRPPPHFASPGVAARTMAASEIVVARGLVKRFGPITAVDGIDFAVHQGECFGFLGPNGAGKTSTIRMIACVSPVTAGELTVATMDVSREPRRIKSV